jgi:benzylsuccinate CoA-transferase BbsF subunit
MMATLPLEGVRIADFTWVWAGPYCTLQLAHLGADVIRIETRTRPCVTRLLPPWPEGKPGINRSGYFNQYNQGKRSVTLNYAKPGALEVAHRLVEASDVVTNNFASGVMEKMGLGYEALRKIKPDLIMISLSGYGDTGPFHEYVAYGPAQVPLSGLSSLTGYKGWPPMHAGFSYADPNAGVHGAFAILAALYHRKKTGEGQYIDMSQWECAMGLLPEGIMEYTMNGREPARDGNRDPLIAPHGVFPSKDRFENTGIMIDTWV